MLLFKNTLTIKWCVEEESRWRYTDREHGITVTGSRQFEKARVSNRVKCNSKKSVENYPLDLPVGKYC